MSGALLDSLAQHGLWGTACGLLLTAVVVLYRRNQELMDKRVEDQRLIAEQYRLAVAENTKTMEALTRALERRQL